MQFCLRESYGAMETAGPDYSGAYRDQGLVNVVKWRNGHVINVLYTCCSGPLDVSGLHRLLENVSLSSSVSRTTSKGTCLVVLRV